MHTQQNILKASSESWDRDDRLAFMGEEVILFIRTIEKLKRVYGFSDSDIEDYIRRPRGFLSRVRNGRIANPEWNYNFGTYLESARGLLKKCERREYDFHSLNINPMTFEMFLTQLRQKCQAQFDEVVRGTGLNPKQLAVYEQGTIPRVPRDIIKKLEHAWRTAEGPLSHPKSSGVSVTTATTTDTIKVPCNSTPMQLLPRPRASLFARRNDTYYSDEKNLVDDLRAHNPHAFEYLFKAWNDRLQYFARTILHNPEDARDVVQDTFRIVHKKVEDLKGDRLSSWLHTIVKNLCFSILRRKKLEKRARMTGVYHDGLEDFMSEHSQRPTDHATYQKELTEHLSTAMDTLNPNLRRVIEARDDGVAFDEIAANEAAKVGTIKSRIRYAKRDLQRALKQQNVDLDTLN